MSDEKDYSSAKKFIADNCKADEKDDKGVKVFTISQSGYKQFMSDRGITDETFKQVTDSMNEFNSASVEFLADQLIEDKDLNRSVLKTYSPNGPIEMRYSRSVEHRNPKTGDKVTAYGVVGVTMKIKNRIDKSVIEACSKAIEDAMAE